MTEDARRLDRLPRLTAILLALVAALAISLAVTAASAPAQTNDDVDCEDFSSQDEAQEFFEDQEGDDPNNLDSDEDGQACEDFFATDTTDTTDDARDEQYADRVIAVRGVETGGGGTATPPSGGGMLPLLLSGGALAALIAGGAGVAARRRAAG